MIPRGPDSTRSPHEGVPLLEQNDNATLTDFEPALAVFQSACTARSPSLSEGEATAATLPTSLGDAEFERLPGVAQLRQILERYVEEERQLLESVDGASARDAVTALVSGPEWSKVETQCRDALAACYEPLLHGAAEASATDDAVVNVLNFGGDERNPFGEVDGTDVFTFNGGYGLLEETPDRADDPLLELEQQPLDPALQLEQRVKRYAKQDECRVRDLLPASFAGIGGEGSAELASLHSLGNSDSAPNHSSIHQNITETPEDFITFLNELMDAHPDVLWQCGEWNLLVRLVLLRLEDIPDKALDFSERYFAGAGPRQRFLLLKGLVTSLSGEGRTSPDSAPPLTRRLVTVTLRFASELPSDWVALLDTELDDLLSVFLLNVAIPHATVCSAVDPFAGWLARWCERPSLASAIQHLPESAPTFLERLQSSLPLPESRWPPEEADSHGLCVAAYLLPSFVWCSAALPIAKQLLWCITQRDFPRTWHKTVGCRVVGALRVAAPCLPTAIRMAAFARCCESFTCAVQGEKKEQLKASSVTVQSFLWYLSVAEVFLGSKASPPAEDVDKVPDLLAEQLKSVHAATERVWRACEQSEGGTHVARRILSFWRAVLRHFDSACEMMVVKSAVPAALKGSPLDVHLVVNATASIDLWFAIRRVLLTQPQSVNLDYEVVLSAILGFELGSPEGPDDVTPFLKSTTCVLLMRWCTLPRAGAGLRQAAQAKLASMEAPLFFERAAVRDTPLLIPTEIIRGRVEGEGAESIASTDLELPPAAKRELDVTSLYQSVRLLLGVAQIPLSDGGAEVTTQAEELFVTQVLVQIERTFLVSSVGDGNATEPTPLGEDSLLTLLSIAALSVLVSLEAERWLWRSTAPEADQHERLRSLRALCVARKGVDPIYFLVRFLTSGGKGKKRLESIFLHGFAADLHVEATLAVDSFVDGEDYPKRVPTPRSLGELSSAARGNSTSEATFAEATALVKAAFGDGEATTTALPVLCEFVQLIQMTHLSASADDLVRVLQRRTREEWVAFGSTAALAEAVTRKAVSLLRANSDDLLSTLTESGIDMHFLSCMCVASWLRAPPLESGSQLKTSLKVFSKRGLASWEDLVARSLVTFACSALHEWGDATRNDASTTALTYPVPSPFSFPSRLMVILLLKPFALEKK